MALASGQPVLGILSGERLAGLAIIQKPEGGVSVPFYEHLGFQVIARNTLGEFEITTLFRARESESQ